MLRYLPTYFSLKKGTMCSVNFKLGKGFCVFFQVKRVVNLTLGRYDVNIKITYF